MINYSEMCRFVNLPVVRKSRYYTVYYLLTNARVMTLEFRFGSQVTTLSCLFNRFIAGLSASKSGEHIGSINFCVNTGLKKNTAKQITLDSEELPSSLPHENQFYLERNCKRDRHKCLEKQGKSFQRDLNGSRNKQKEMSSVCTISVSETFYSMNEP